MHHNSGFLVHTKLYVLLLLFGLQFKQQSSENISKNHYKRC